MLSSFSSSHEEDDEPSDLQYQIPPASRHVTSPANHMRQLLISCAELISQFDFTAAHRLITLLSTNSSPYGDATERLIHQFTRALSSRLNRYSYNFVSSTTTSTATTGVGVMIPTTKTTATAIGDAIIPASSWAPESKSLHSSYLSLNQITPFVRFSHLTANQAILEAVEGHQFIHILDFDTMHGVQWPPLMQALAERSDPSNPPPRIRITGTGQDMDILRRTGDRLQKFAHSLGLTFEFHPLLLHGGDHPTSMALYLPSAVSLLQHETLAVNCVLYLHRLLLRRERDDSRDLRLFLHTLKAMNPKVVTVAETTMANHNHPIFLQRFLEALEHYTAVFDSLEATLPPNSQERLSVEQVWFGREILDIVAAEGDDHRRERHERFQTWADMLRTAGFSNLPLSPFALSQAKLLLRLHYPSEGYQLQIHNDSFFLGWQNQTLFSVSSWH